MRGGISMKIITLEEKEFTKFANQHKYGSFYQSVSYAKVMKKEGYDYHFLGFLNHSNELVGATLFLIKKIFFGYKMAYAPYGFLIDYSDSDFLEELTIKLKKLLMNQKFIYIKISPRIHCSERDQKGNIISYNPNTNDYLEILQKCGYLHCGFHNYFEDLKPRWNAILKLDSSNEELYHHFSKQVRNKIQKAKKCGVTFEEGTIDNLETVYEFIKKKQFHSFSYYQNLFQEFGDNAKLYLARLNTEKYVSQSKELYEKEYELNEKINQDLQEYSKNGKNLASIITKKMESDRNLARYQFNLSQASQLLSQYPQGIIIGGMIGISDQKTMNLIIEGYHHDFGSFDPNYYLKWELIKILNNTGYQYFHMNGISGVFQEKNKYSGLNESKLGYHASAIEYIGEFDFIINSFMYQLYQKKGKKG